MADAMVAATRTLLREAELPRAAVVIDSWDVVYDLKHDSFLVTINWDEYGYGLKVSTASLGAIAALFDAAARHGGRVIFDGQGGNFKLEFSGMHAR